MKLSSVARVTGGKLFGDCEFFGSAYDSREVKNGNLFVCLPGERTDGHNFAFSAEKNGASCLLCERKTDSELPYVLVENSLEALRKYAAYRMTELPVKTVAVTGSVGKTTTKDFIKSVLSSSRNVYSVIGNKNSDIGLPSVILGIDEKSEFFVAEMGMSNFGEISLLSKIARPTVGVITNIGFCHLEFLGSRENILKAKLEITDGMSDDGILVLNGDDEYLSKVSIPERKIIFYGINNGKCDIKAENIRVSEGKTSFRIVGKDFSFDAEIPVEGLHNVYNSLAACAVGKIFDLSDIDIAKGLSSFTPSPMRQNIFEKNGFTFIEDCYNASPTSMEAAASVLKSKNGRKLAVIGDMLELGEDSAALHETVGSYFSFADALICYGNFAGNYASGAEKSGLSPEKIFICDSSEKAFSALYENAERGDTLLFKASRGMAAEKICEKFIQATENGRKDG